MRWGTLTLWLVFLLASASGRLWPQSSSSAQEAFARGTRLYGAGDFDGAIREYRAALALDPTNFEARSNLGVALARIGHYEEAIAVYRQALENAPPAAANHLRMNLALAYYKSGQISEAAGLFDGVQKELPDDLQVTLLTADCYLRLGNFERVIELLSPLADARSGDSAVNYMLGMALIRSGNVEKGQALVDSILRDSESAEAHFVLGSVAFMANDYPGAVKQFSKAAGINPDLPSLQSYYGQALLFTGDPEGATAAFRAQLASDPNDYDSNLGLAQILFQRRQTGEARPLYERALRVRPGSAEAAYGLAEVDLAEHRPEQARQRLEQLVTRWPSYAAAHRALSVADEELGRKPEAARERAAAGKLEGGNASGGIPLGAVAPDFTLLPPSGDRRVRLSEFRGKRPVVLVLGSYTCPKFRLQAPVLNALYERYHDRAEFLLVYIREAHGAGSWQSTINRREGVDLADAATFDQKREYAASCIRKLKIPYAAAVDPLDNAAETAYTAWPSRVYLIDKQGHVAFNSPLDELNFDASKLDSALQSVSARIR
jgi:tetratricopeptide (TPR) repeat protein